MFTFLLVSYEATKRIAFFAQTCCRHKFGYCAPVLATKLLMGVSGQHKGLGVTREHVVAHSYEGSTGVWDRVVKCGIWHDGTR